MGTTSGNATGARYEGRKETKRSGTQRTPRRICSRVGRGRGGAVVRGENGIAGIRLQGPLTPVNDPYTGMRLVYTRIKFGICPWWGIAPKYGAPDQHQT